MSNARVFVSIVALIAGVASAQPADGDFIVGVQGASGNVAYIDRTTGRLHGITSSTVLPNGFTNAVMMAANNVDIVAIDTNLNASLVLSVTPTGAITTLATLALPPTAGDVLQNGNYAFATLVDVLEIDSGGKVTTLLGSVSSTLPNGMARDPDRDTLLFGAGFGDLVEWDPRANTLTTLCRSTPGFLDGVEPMPRGWNGNSSAAIAASLAPQLRICSSGMLVSSLATTPSANANALKVDDATGHVYLATTPGYVFEFDPTTSALVNTWGPFAGGFSGIDTYGSRRVVGVGSGAPGSNYNVGIHFGAAAANAPVFIALSLAQRPGIPVPGGGRINLAADPLFLASARGLFHGVLFVGFRATLDGTGRGGGAIRIPSFAPKGLTLYFSAIALAPPSRILTANTIGVRVP